jgi:hypothetical protein
MSLHYLMDAVRHGLAPAEKASLDVKQQGEPVGDSSTNAGGESKTRVEKTDPKVWPPRSA